MSKQRQELLDRLLENGEQSAYEAALAAIAETRRKRLARMEDSRARRAAEQDVEDLADRAIDRDGFDPDLDLE